MPQNSQDPPQNVHHLFPANAETITARLSELREGVVRAWRERGVYLNTEECDVLRHEIDVTCKFLKDLTRSGS